MLEISKEIKIWPHELMFTYTRSSGPGGQNVNKVNSKVLLYWSPLRLPPDMLARFSQKFANKINADGLVLITSDRFRDRVLNQDDCVNKLKEMLLSVLHAPKPRKKTKPSYSSKLRNQSSKQKQSQKKKLRSSRYEDS